MRPATLLLTVIVLAGCTGPMSPTATPTKPSAMKSPRATTETTAVTTPTADRAVAGTPRPPVATFVINGRSSVTITLELADTPEERREGLMGRQSLARNHGMLFIYPDEAPRTFWMKNTLVPLDMIFIDANGTVLNVEHAMPQPNATDDELRRYHSAGPAKYVVEVRRGFANRTGVVPGTEVRFSLNRSTGTRD